MTTTIILWVGPKFILVTSLTCNFAQPVGYLIIVVSGFLYIINLAIRNSAARFGDLSPFGRLFVPFGDQNFDLATFRFGDFLGVFSKI